MFTPRDGWGWNALYDLCTAACGGDGTGGEGYASYHCTDCLCQRALFLGLQ
jgi:hypothetical protein